MGSILKGRKMVLLRDVLKVVSEFEILSHYFHIDKIPTLINSPLRDDKSPSMGLYTNDGSKIYFHDFKTRESGGTIDLLSLLWGTSFEDTLKRIDDELVNIKKIKATTFEQKQHQTSSSSVSDLIRAKQMIMSSSIDLKVRVRDWKDYDEEYWETSGISKKWAIFGNIYPISHIFIRKGKKDDWIIIPADKYAYAYLERKDKKETLKIYQPFSDKFKWRNKHDASVWDLWELIPPEGEDLIITSSRKDALTIWENSGIPALSLQSETYMPKKHVVNQLKKRYKNIYVLYDNDFNKEINTGKINGMNLAKTFGLTYIEIPKESGEKDPSDIVKRYGREALRKLIHRLISDK